MRKSVVLILLCVLSCTVVANAQFKKSVHEAPRQRIMVGVGMGPITPGMEFYSFSRYDYYIMRPEYNSLINYYYGEIDRVYCGRTLSSGAIFVDYGFRVRRWLELSMNITYTGFCTEIHSVETNKKIRNENYFYISAIPMARFMWVRTSYVNLYSGVGFGLSYDSSNGKYLQGGREYRSDVIYPAFNIIPIGISAGGKRVYAFSELCIGMSGMLNSGIGIRF